MITSSPWGALCALLIVLTAGCGDSSAPAEHGQEHANGSGNHAHGGGSERPPLVYTDYTPATELFVEFPALVKGQASTFAAHFTRESDFEPLRSGMVTVLLERNGAVAAGFRVREPARTGIFTPVVTPRDVGRFDLVVTVTDGDLSARHELGPVEVFASVDAVVVNQPEGEGDIGYLKEQQWNSPYAITMALERPLRASVPGFATVLAPADAGAEVRAAADGYIAASALTPAGAQVEAGDVLAYLIPRLGEGSDLGGLVVAAEKAKVSETIARKDVERLEDLYSKGAVPERRLNAARHELEVAVVELRAARARLEQYQRGNEEAGIAIRAPVSGEVIESTVRPGAFVRNGERLFRLAAPDRRWLEVRVPEHYASRLPSASGAWLDATGADTVVLDAGNGARVVQLSTAIDPVTRSAGVAIEYPATAGPTSVGARLPAHVFLEEPQLRLAVPRSALVEDGGRIVVYEQTGGEMFVRRPVETGIVDGDLIEIVEGLRGGERVVSEGAYLVRLAAAGGDDIGHGHAH